MVKSVTERINFSRNIWVDSLPAGYVSDFNPAKQAGLLSDLGDLKTKKYDAVIVGAGHNGLVAGSWDFYALYCDETKKAKRKL